MIEKDKKEIEQYIKKVQSDSDKNNQKHFQEFKDEIKKEFANQTGVLTEDFQHKVSAIGEQYSGIQKTLETHTKMLEELTKGETLTRVQISDHESRITTLETKV